MLLLLPLGFEVPRAMYSYRVLPVHETAAGSRFLGGLNETDHGTQQMDADADAHCVDRSESHPCTTLPENTNLAGQLVTVVSLL